MSTSPRKEQLNDLRSYFTRIDSYNGISFGTPDVAGGTIQTISGSNYTSLLGSTVTNAVGGSESDTSAFLFGAIGPFQTPIAAGNSFNITLPNVNNGNPVLITFQGPDTVTINGNLYISTSNVANRINTTLAGIVSGGNVPLAYPVAANVNGQLVLTSSGPSGYTTGSSSYITVSDASTAGMVAALGFTTLSAVTSNGVSSPSRGVITTSSDGNGGYVLLRMPDGSPAITQSNVQVNVGGLGNLPIYPAGQRIYGRLQQFPGIAPKFVVSYVRQGAIQGSIITSGGQFSTLTTSETFNITVNTLNPNSGSPEILTTYGPFIVSFGSAPTSPQSVVNYINAAWNTVTGSAFTSATGASYGGIQGSIPGPWSFGSGDIFIISLNGQPDILINPTDPMSANDLAAFINSQISTAGQSAQGQAIANNGSIQIVSKFATGSNSTVQIIAYNEYDSPVLDKIGMSPGIYSGSAIAILYGNDEIQFICPDHTVSDANFNPASITVSGSSGVMTKLGLVGTSITGTSQITNKSFEPVSPPTVQALIPEMMSFGEVPENIETTIDQFLTSGIPSPTNPSNGTGNVGTSPLLGLDGRINPDLIKKLFDVLNVGSLTLGSNNVLNIQNAFTPSLYTPFASTTTNGPTLVWQAESVAGLTGTGASQILRLYIDQNGGIWLTSNASWNAFIGSDLTWNKDTASQPASALYIGQSNEITSSFGGAFPKLELLYVNAVVSSPFNFSDTTPNVGLDPSGIRGGSTLGSGANSFISAGTSSPSSAFENLIPRLLANVSATTGYTLILQTSTNSSMPNIRLYCKTITAPSHSVIFSLTLNAYWNGSAWAKDVTGSASSALQLLSGGSGATLVYYFQPSGGGTWADGSWSVTPFSSNSSGTGVQGVGYLSSSGVDGTGGTSGIGVTGEGGVPAANMSGNAGVQGTGSALNGSGSIDGTGVIGQGGGSTNGIGVQGTGTGTAPGIWGFGSTIANGPGVIGEGGGSAPGIIGINPTGIGPGGEFAGGGTSPGAYGYGNGSSSIPFVRNNAGFIGVGGTSGGGGNGVVGFGIGIYSGLIGVGAGGVIDGSTAASAQYSGVYAIGGSSNGPGIFSEGTGTGSGGIFYGGSSGGGDGIDVYGSNGGDAVAATITGGGGVAIRAINNGTGHAVFAESAGAGDAISATATGSGNAVLAEASGATAIVGQANANNHIGVQGIGNGSGSGVSGQSGVTNFSVGVSGTSIAINGIGVSGQGTGTGTGGIFYGGINGPGITAIAGSGQASVLCNEGPVVLPSATCAAPATPVDNGLYSDNIVKAFGKVKLGGSPTFNTSSFEGDCFNTGSSTSISGNSSSISIPLANGMANNTNYIVIANCYDSSNVPVLVAGKSSSTTAFFVQSGTAFLNDQYIEFVIYGKQ